MKCIKDVECNILMEEALIRLRWQIYFHKILNEVGNRKKKLGELEHIGSHYNFGYYKHINVEEVKGIICRMNKRKVIGQTISQ